MIEDITDTKLSRRQFMGTAAAGAAALGAVAGASSLVPHVLGAPSGAAAKGLPAGGGLSAQPVQVPTNWSQTADVVVVGYGGAGAVAAITAFDAGANVLILEKTPSYVAMGVTNPLISGGGGSTSMNAGNAIYVTDQVAAANYLYQGSWGNTPMSDCQGLAAMLTQNLAWLTQMGIKYTLSTFATEFPTLGTAGAGGISLTGGGFSFFTQLDGLVQKRGIPILFNTPATDLIQNPMTKEILGVKALANASEVLNIKANRGVILTTGSFEFNEAMKADNLRCYPAHMSGWQFCTGDSVRMASKVGAAMWHMSVMSCNLAAWFPQYPIAFGGSSPSQHGYIYVDIHGNRWGDETQLGFTAHPWNFWLKLSDFDLNVPGYTRIPTFIIFDETCRKAGAISSGKSATSMLPTYLDNRPTWSSDNSVEIGKGWIQQGADIPTLVAAMNATTYIGVPPGTNNMGPSANIRVKIDPAVLTATVNAWNSACAAKVDSQFGRPASSLVPIQTPPFYAMALWPGGPSLYGGPVRNIEGQVCDADNNPIPRLYAAGENGCVAGGLLDVTTNNGQIIALGRVAGNNAATEVPWS